MKKTFHIPDMHCTACVMRLEGIEDELAGIQRINASYRQQIMTVEWDEKQVNKMQIIKAVLQKGYNINE